MSGVITAGFALPKDAAAIAAVLEANRADPSLYLRGQTDVEKHIAEFVVVRGASGEVLGCAAIHPFGTMRAEILSVAVLPQRQKRGVGTLLVETSLAWARAAGNRQVYLATMKPEYFARFGFQRLRRRDVPLRVLLAVILPVFGQPLDRWKVALRQGEIFMRYDL